MDNTKQTVDLFDKYAQSYQSKYMSVEKYKKSLDSFCSSLPCQKASILELACGPGNITKYLLEQNPEFKIHATDLSPAMLKLAEENNPSATFQILDCRSIKALKTSYDAIICGFGLPYVSKEDAVSMIKDARDSLNDGGLLYLSTMEGQYSNSGMQYSGSDTDEGLYMYFHESAYLESTMENAGLTIIDKSKVKYIDDKNNEVIDLILIGKKL